MVLKLVSTTETAIRAVCVREVRLWWI